MDTLPAMDQEANSMYGGSQGIFQEQVAPIQQQPTVQPAYAQTAYAQPAPQPVVAPAPVQYAGPPLPATGLPDGWTMEQWAYYGQQYLDQMQ